MLQALVLFSTTTPSTQDILDGTSSIITTLLSLMTQITNWILGNNLAVFFFSIMILMLAIHFLHSVIHKFS